MTMNTFSFLSRYAQPRSTASQHAFGSVNAVIRTGIPCTLKSPYPPDSPLA